MNLEDHVGDVIRKARLMINVSPENAATSANKSTGTRLSIRSQRLKRFKAAK
jgi:hypothetical protein